MAAIAVTTGDRRASAGAAAIIAAVLALSLAGVFLALHELGLVAADGRSASGVHRISEDVPTSFGIVAVEYVRSVPGLSHRSLSGATHGVSGLVDDNHVLIQAAVAVTNRVSHPISYRARQFQLLVTRRGKTTVQSATGGDLPDMRVLPNAGIEGHLDFSVPRTGATLALRFRDPGHPDVVIDLGRAHFPAAGVDAGHSHH